MSAPPPKDLLPPNSTPFERTLSKTSARLLDTDTDIIRRERDPLRCDKAFLPFLGMERSVHHYTGTDEASDRARHRLLLRRSRVLRHARRAGR